LREFAVQVHVLLGIVPVAVFAGLLVVTVVVALMEMNVTVGLVLGEAGTMTTMTTSNRTLALE